MAENTLHTTGEARKPKHDIQQLVGNTLRFGVSLACLVAFIGGVIYLVKHGGEAFSIDDYKDFAYGNAAQHADYTTLRGIGEGLLSFTAVGWIQTGVLILILTPIMRVLLSLFDFLQERDWLYALITAIVLAVIISNSLEGFK